MSRKPQGCFCDKTRFPECPGHGPNGLKGLKSRTKPTGRQELVDKAVRWAKSLRPSLSDEDALRHAKSSKRWAFACWHLPNHGLGVGQDPSAPMPAMPGHGKNLVGSPTMAPRTGAFA